jgi:hypothetical protein
MGSQFLGLEILENLLRKPIYWLRKPANWLKKPFILAWEATNWLWKPANWLGKP